MKFHSSIEIIIIHLIFSFVVDGMWGTWTPSGGCSVTCGTGQQTYTRSCDSPAESCGGQTCIGDSTKIESCDEGCCPGKLVFTMYTF